MNLGRISLDVFCRVVEGEGYLIDVFRRYCSQCVHSLNGHSCSEKGKSCRAAVDVNGETNEYSILLEPTMFEKR